MPGSRGAAVAIMRATSSLLARGDQQHGVHDAVHVADVTNYGRIRRPVKKFFTAWPTAPCSGHADPQAVMGGRTAVRDGPSSDFHRSGLPRTAMSQTRVTRRSTVLVSVIVDARVFWFGLV